MTKAELKCARVIADTAMYRIGEACLDMCGCDGIEEYIEYYRIYMYSCGILYAVWRMGGLSDDDYLDRLNNARECRRLALHEEE